MSATNVLHEQAATLFQTINDVIDDGAQWRTDLEDAIADANLSDDQKQVIRDASTTLTFQHIGHQDDHVNDFTQRLTHAFSDSIRNSASTLSLVSDPDFADLAEPDTLLRSLVEIRYAIQDISHNYPLILSPNVPQTVSDILDKYNDEILPVIDDMILEIEAAQDLNSEDYARNENFQHVFPLPADEFDTPLSLIHI